MNNKVLIPMSGEKGTPIPGVSTFCELLSGGKFIGYYDETLDEFIDTEDEDESYPRNRVIWYTEYEK